MMGSRKASLAEARMANLAEARKASMAEVRKASLVGSRKGSLPPPAPKALDLDDVLVNELGQFGRYQLTNILLVVIPMAMTAFMSEFVFSAAATPHRCQISECGENSKDVYFSPVWLNNTIPTTSSGFASCQRFVPTGGNGSLASCPANLFNKEQTQDCDGFVYSRSNTVVYEFDLGCNDWLRALAGTLNSLGTMLVLPFVGYISDNFGRRITLIISVFNMGAIGIIRAFSVSYPMYLAFQLLQTTLGSGTYSAAYIFAMEMVGPKYRVLTTATCSSFFALGQVILGCVAWLIQPWRYMIIALNVPCFLIIAYYWLIAESVRWLLSKEKYTEAKKILENVARVNKTTISEKSLQALMVPPVVTDKSNEPSLIKSIFKSRILLRRVCTTPIWWATTILVYYGLSINSASLSDSIYLNYILTCAVEIPGFFTAALVLDKIGRKKTLLIGYLISSACNLTFAFLETDKPDLYVVRLIIYLLGKFGISVVLTSSYLYTAELYPTQYRHSLIAFSSMIGRIGSITAPFTPILAEYWAGLPSMLFGCMGIISGLLVLTQPETRGTKMPDTLEEAEALGTPQSKLNTTS